MKASKERLDVLLTQRGFFNSRERAKVEIMSGNIFVDNKMIDKPGTLVNIESKIEIKGKALPYVSRGGLKLEKALSVFNIDVEGKVAIDAGASTGGFTDCLLKNRAQKVYAVDVGYGQLDYNLRQDRRVVVLERTNVRYLKFEDIGEEVDIITADLSFISLSKVFEPFYRLLKSDGNLIALIKPQFEVERHEVGKNGVVRNKDLHVKVIKKIIEYAGQMKFYCWGIDFSPITGPKGNIEFLGWFRKWERPDFSEELGIKKAVEKAHLELS